MKLVPLQPTDDVNAEARPRLTADGGVNDRRRRSAEAHMGTRCVYGTGFDEPGRGETPPAANRQVSDITETGCGRALHDGFADGQKGL